VLCTCSYFFQLVPEFSNACVSYESFILMCSDSEEKHLLHVLVLHQACLNRVSLIYKSTGSGIIKSSKYSRCGIRFPDYLQTSSLDMFTAWSLVDSATTKLKEQTRTFHTVHSKALEFVTTCNDKINCLCCTNRNSSDWTMRSIIKLNTFTRKSARVISFIINKLICHAID
jgi:hypothetical protein